MKRKELIELFVDVAKRNETYEGMIQEIRCLESDGEISKKDYDFLLQKWDVLLAEYGL